MRKNTSSPESYEETMTKLRPGIMLAMVVIVFLMLMRTVALTRRYAETGIPVRAHVVEAGGCLRIRFTHSQQVHYVYAVDGEEYQGAGPWRCNAYRKLRVGEEITAVYLPESHGTSKMMLWDDDIAAGIQRRYPGVSWP